VKEKKGK